MKQHTHLKHTQHVLWLFSAMFMVAVLGYPAMSKNAESQNTTETTIRPAPASFESRYLVLLERTGKPPIDAAKMQQLQQAHLLNLRKMAEAGYLLVAGPTRPISDQPSNLAGVLILRPVNEQDRTKIEDMIKTDPMVEAGFLTAHPHTLMFETGDNLYKRNPRIIENGTD